MPEEKVMMRGTGLGGPMLKTHERREVAYTGVTYQTHSPALDE